MNGKPVGGGWSIEDGVIHRGKLIAGSIITKEHYTDFELIFDWKISGSGNSGVKYRARKNLGLEYQVLDDKGHPNGKNPLTRAGSIYALYPASDDKTLKPVGEWNTGRILVQGNHVEHWLNGEQVLEAEIGSDEWKKRFAASKYHKHDGFGTWTGNILLQDHSDPVWYRNVRIREL